MNTSKVMGRIASVAAQDLADVLSQCIQDGWMARGDQVRKVLVEKLPREWKEGFPVSASYSDRARPGDGHVEKLVQACIPLVVPHMLISESLREAYDSTEITSVFSYDVTLKHSRSFRRGFLGQLWSGFMVQEHAFDWAWRLWSASVKEKNSSSDEPEPTKQRLDTLHLKLLEGFQAQQTGIFPHLTTTAEGVWRAEFFRLFYHLVWMLEYGDSAGYRYGRDLETRLEAAYHQDLLVEGLRAHRKWIPVFLKGWLDYLPGEHWPLMEGVADRLGPALCAQHLSAYNGAASAEHHAHSLARELSGDLPPLSLGLARKDPPSYPKPFISSINRPWSTWLVPSDAEELIFLATEAAMVDHRAYLDSQWGQDEHEHCQNFADCLSRHLNGLAPQLSELFRGQREALFLNTNIRRIPRRAAKGHVGEGGSDGWQADLGIVIRANFPDRIEISRGTLFQAKKLGQDSQGIWEHRLHIDRSQLDQLLGMSAESHYLFFMHSAVAARSPLTLRAQLLDDLLKSQGRRLRQDVLRQTGKSFPETFVSDLLGGWYGDKSLVPGLLSGCEVGQGPRVLLEVNIAVDQVG